MVKLLSRLHYHSLYLMCYKADKHYELPDGFLKYDRGKADMTQTDSQPNIELWDSNMSAKWELELCIF